MNKKDTEKERLKWYAVRQALTGFHWEERDVRKRTSWRGSASPLTHYFSSIVCTFLKDLMELKTLWRKQW